MTLTASTRPPSTELDPTGPTLSDGDSASETTGVQLHDVPLIVPSRRFGQSLWAIAYKETLQIVRDRRTLGMMLAMPLMQLLLFGFAVGTTVAHIPTVVVDQARDADSRALVESFVNTTYFDVAGYVDAPADAREAIDVGRARSEEHTSELQSH